MALLYHEKQVAALCGVHTLNTLLQGPYFNEMDLAQIGAELDRLEREVLGDEAAGAAGPSTNLDDSGMFSVQVLAKALEVWGLTAVPVGAAEIGAGGYEATAEAAFICNLLEHWFTVRRIGDSYYNFNSLYPAPEALSTFHLTAYLDSLKQQGYTIFVVRGQLPAAPGENGAEAIEGPGRYFTPDEAREAHRAAQQGRQQGRARHAVEGALERAAAGGGAIALRPRQRRRLSNGSSGDEEMLGGGSGDEDADLAAAIAASMQEQQQQGGSGGGGGGGAAAAGGGGGGSGFEDDDPELAAALAASLADHAPSQPQPDAEEEEQQPEEEEDVEVPAEPAEGADGALLVAFRLPSGQRLSRRFLHTDCVAAAAAYVAGQLRESGELARGRRVVLSTQFPKQALEDGAAQLAAAGVGDRDILTVTTV